MAIAGATLATASVTALAGAVGWIGLVVPHAARLLGGPDLRRLLPLSMLLGAAFLLRSRRAERGAGIAVVLAILASAITAGVVAVERMLNPAGP